MDGVDLIAGRADSGLHLQPGHVEINMIERFLSQLKNIVSDMKSLCLEVNLKVRSEVKLREDPVVTRNQEAQRDRATCQHGYQEQRR